MAVTNLRLVFRGLGDKRVNFSYPGADSNASAAQVKTLMQIMVANGAIFPLYLNGGVLMNYNIH